MGEGTTISQATAARRPVNGPAEIKNIAASYPEINLGAKIAEEGP
jgi:hypothetical protein